MNIIQYYYLFGLSPGYYKFYVKKYITYNINIFNMIQFFKKYLDIFSANDISLNIIHNLLHNDKKKIIRVF